MESSGYNYATLMASLYHEENLGWGGFKFKFFIFNFLIISMTIIIAVSITSYMTAGLYVGITMSIYS